MSKSTRYSPDVREHAVRLVLEYKGEWQSQWAGIGSIATKIGCKSRDLETLRKRERQAGRAVSGAA